MDTLNDDLGSLLVYPTERQTRRKLSLTVKCCTFLIVVKYGDIRTCAVQWEGILGTESITIPIKPNKDRPNSPYIWDGLASRLDNLPSETQSRIEWLGYRATEQQLSRLIYALWLADWLDNHTGSSIPRPVSQQLQRLHTHEVWKAPNGASAKPSRRWLQQALLKLEVAHSKGYHNDHPSSLHLTVKGKAWSEVDKAYIPRYRREDTDAGEVGRDVRADNRQRTLFIQGIGDII